MGVDETLLSEIVRRVLRVARPERIILFGSAATGQMTKDSDIDLLIVEQAPKNRHEESVAIADAIGDVAFPVDVKIIASERFEATKNIIGGIAYPAHKYGRVLYAAA
jgi:predicted nucleotidyltransferase